MKKLLATNAVPLNVLVNAAVLLLSVFVFDWGPEEVAAVQGFALAVMGLLTYSSVASAATVATVATEAATRAVEKVTDTTAGAVGEVTSAGTQVVGETVKEVVGGVGGLVGGLAGGLAGRRNR